MRGFNKKKPSANLKKTEKKISIFFFQKNFCQELPQRRKPPCEMKKKRKKSISFFPFFLPPPSFSLPSAQSLLRPLFLAFPFVFVTFLQFMQKKKGPECNYFEKQRGDEGWKEGGGGGGVESEEGEKRFILNGGIFSEEFNNSAKGRKFAQFIIALRIIVM